MLLFSMLLMTFTMVFIAYRTDEFLLSFGIGDGFNRGQDTPRQKNEYSDEEKNENEVDHGV